MALTNNKIYKIDDKPVSPSELIQAASKIDNDFRFSNVKTTSCAADILRSYGHIINVNNSNGE